MFDILIPSAEKDFVKFKFVYDSIVKYIEGYKGIFCISPVKVPGNLKIIGVNYFLDSDVIDFDFSLYKGNIQKRTGWYRQQFVKLFQNVTGDEYLVTECDNIYNKKVTIIEDEKPVFLLGKDQNHKPYYDITQKLFGFGREYPYSFINEVMYIKRNFVNELVSLRGLNKHGFFGLIASELNRTQEISGLSDYDLYGNFVAKYHKDAYLYKQVDTVVTAKLKEWSAAEINKHLQQHTASNNSMIKIHSWI
jgi:hypothetical protein